VLGFKAGTEQIEQKLKELFPSVRTLRMDRDTTGTKDSYEKILSAFANQEADVLIGTQMIVKGHDFPNVTLVGVLAADLSLGVNDYRAGERTFQLLTQAVGRAGRGEKPGYAVIQTYQPEHYAVVAAAAQDYEGFYQEEILYRELGGYPPVHHLLAVQVFSPDEKAGEKLAANLTEQARRMISDRKTMLLGPSPASIGKVNDIYRYVLYLKSPDYQKLVEIKDQLETYQTQQQNTRENIQFDFDPMNFL
jgi:primosomal protein N' (replication factor Y)